MSLLFNLAPLIETVQQTMKLQSTIFNVKFSSFKRQLKTFLFKKKIQVLFKKEISENSDIQHAPSHFLTKSNELCKWKRFMLAHVPLRHLHSPGQSRASLQSETSSEAEPETGV